MNTEDYMKQCWKPGSGNHTTEQLDILAAMTEEDRRMAVGSEEWKQLIAEARKGIEAEAEIARINGFRENTASKLHRANDVKNELVAQLTAAQTECEALRKDKERLRDSLIEPIYALRMAIAQYEHFIKGLGDVGKQVDQLQMNIVRMAADDIQRAWSEAGGKHPGIPDAAIASGVGE